MKKIIIVFLISFSFSKVRAQLLEMDSVYTSKHEFGFSLGGDFINNDFLFSFLPYYSYDLHPRVCVGAGPNLMVFTNRFFLSPSLIYGVNGFVKGYISQSFYGQIENDLINRQFPGSTNSGIRRNWVNEILIGGGYRKTMKFGYAFFSGFYIANYLSTKSPYPRPLLFRAGVSLRMDSELLK